LIVVPLQRTEAGTVLFAVANTTTLAVVAVVRDRDWSALNLRSGDSIAVRIPARSGEVLTATVDYVGRTLSASTEAVPLMALVTNSDGLLRPGMFAWVLVPNGADSESVIVPESCVQTRNGQEFVFIEEDKGTYRRQPVTVGRVAAGDAVIRPFFTSYAAAYFR